MTPRRLALLTVVAVVVVAAACQQPAPPPTPDVASPVDGVVTSVDAAGLTDVRGFTLSNGGFSFAFRLGALENATEFPPAHLAEHQATSSPVRVWFRLEGGVRVAYRLEDAGAAAT